MTDLLSETFGTPAKKQKLLDKLYAGWWWTTQIIRQWCYTMANDDGEFFNYLQTDYVKYEEEMHYDRGLKNYD